jgi:hypothetical protein
MRLASLKNECKRRPLQLLVGMFLLCGFFAGITVLVSDLSPRTVVGGWFVIAVLIGSRVWIEESLKTSKLARSIARTLESGRIREIRIVASSVVELEEEEDEGACYAFQIAADRIVFVSGQEFCASANFPNADFALVDVLSPSGERVDFFIRKDGARLVPTRIVSAQTKRGLRVPSHLEVVAGKLEQLEQLLA